MLRRTYVQSRAVPFASLFSYNHVLASVFSTPGNRICLSVEKPGKACETFTFGSLQRDVVALADRIAKDVDCGATERNKRSLCLQAPRPSNVMGLFHAHHGWKNGGADAPGGAAKNLYSHECLADDGSYNVAILSSASYEYTVSMLALWALGLMAVPMAPQHHYEGEMTHILEHSACRLLVTEQHIMQDKLPDAYKSLAAGGDGSVGHGTTNAASSQVALTTEKTTFNVHSVLNITDWMARRRARLITESDHGGALDDHDGDVEVLPPEVKELPARTADEVMERIDATRDAEQQRARDRMEDAMMDEFRQIMDRSRGDDASFIPPLSFDDSRVDAELNHIFVGRWHAMQTSQRASCFLPNEANDCLMIYTSGTTAKPKGVVHTHASIDNQVAVLQRAWRWSSEDKILNTLPLHHVHGIVNVLLCSLASGAHCVLSPFDSATRVAQRLEQGDITLFMGVPTMYVNLINAVEKLSPIERTGWRNAVRQNVRLMVSGSAALPVSVLQQFRTLSGHTLLERYGMTEVGMALSQPYQPVEERCPGSVGLPLPGVDTSVVLSSSPQADDGGVVGGPLLLRSKSLFDRYWANPAATVGELVVHDGKHFFSTGDTVGTILSASGRGQFQILGRTSIDIIKHKGFKLSALEIEAALLQLHDSFAEVAVFGLPHDSFGEEVVAVVVLRQKRRCLSTEKNGGGTEPMTFADVEVQEELRQIVKTRLASYKAPSRFVVVDKIPRNAMGKVNKKDLQRTLSRTA